MPKFQLSIIQFPSGRFGFVGSVPKDLAIRHRNNEKVCVGIWEDYRKASNPDMVKRAYNLVVPVFNSRAEAVAFAAECGIDVPNE